MLQFIRDRAQSWIAIIIVGMLILALGAFAWDSYFRTDPVVSAAFVNGEKVTAAEFQRAYQTQRARLQEMFGGIDIDKIIPDEQKFKRDILDQLIREELIWQSAQKAGYRVSDAFLGASIREFPAFQTDGKFDREKYERLLRQNFWTPAQYEAVVRKEMIIQQYRQGILSTAWLTSQEQDYLIRKQEQQRDIGYIDVALTHFLDQVEVSDDEARAYYDDNGDRFMAPEQVAIEYIELSVDDLMPQVEVDDATLREIYESRRMEFVTPEQRRVRHILVEGDDEAALERIRELRAAIEAGKPFEEVAKASSDDFGSAAQGGDLGFLDRDAMMDPAFADAAYALEKGELSEPVKSAYGYHLIEVTEIRPKQVKTFEEVRAQLEEEYRRQQAEELFYDKGEILANVAFENPDSLEPAAEETGLSIETTPLFTRDGGLGIAMDPKVRAAAFSDEVLAGNNSEPVELDDTHLVVLRVREHIEAQPRPFESVKEEILDLLRVEKASALAREAGDALLAALREGGDPARLAEEKGWSWRPLGLIKRDGGAIGDREVVEYAFRLPHPQEGEKVFGAVAKGTGDYAVVVLSQVVDGDPEAIDEATRQALVQGRQRALGIAELVAAMEELRRRADVVIKPENL